MKLSTSFTTIKPRVKYIKVGDSIELATHEEYGLNQLHQVSVYTWRGHSQEEDIYKEGIYTRRRYTEEIQI